VGSLESGGDQSTDGNALYAAGYVDVGGDDQWRIEKRSLADGSLVAEFGVGGVMTDNPSATMAG
jgi:hypothetical protein